MKNHLYILCLFITVFSIIGCSKDDDDDQPAQKTNTELITSSTWKFNSATSSGVDVSGFLEACQKDNVFTLQADGNGSMEEGTTKCDPGDPQTTPFTWNFTNNENTLHVSTVLFDGGSSDFTIVSLTDTELTVSQQVDIGLGPQTVVIKFVH